MRRLTNSRRRELSFTGIRQTAEVCSEHPVLLLFPFRRYRCLLQQYTLPKLLDNAYCDIQ